jgi:hypothetical protein
MPTFKHHFYRHAQAQLYRTSQPTATSIPTHLHHNALCGPSGSMRLLDELSLNDDSMGVNPTFGHSPIPSYRIKHSPLSLFPALHSVKIHHFHSNFDHPTHTAHPAATGRCLPKLCPVPALYCPQSPRSQQEIRLAC